LIKNGYFNVLTKNTKQNFPCSAKRLVVQKGYLRLLLGSFSHQRAKQNGKHHFSKVWEIILMSFHHYHWCFTNDLYSI